MDSLVLELDKTRSRDCNQNEERVFMVLKDRVVIADVCNVDVLVGLYLDTLDLRKVWTRKEFMYDEVQGAGICRQDGTGVVYWKMDRGVLMENCEFLPPEVGQALKQALVKAEPASAP